MAKCGYDKDDIRRRLHRMYPELADPFFTLENIRRTYSFDETCQGSVPQAIRVFLEANDFEDTIKKAILLGGDTDTIAAIAGSIAEAYYGVPHWMEIEANVYLKRARLYETVLRLEYERRYL